MKINRLSESEFDKFYESLNVDPQYEKTLFYNLYNEVIDSMISPAYSKAFEPFDFLNNYELIIYIISEIVYFTRGASKEKILSIKDDSRFLSYAVSSSVDKYITNEKVNLKINYFASKYSPNVSTLTLYLKYLSKILESYSVGDPLKSLVADIINKCVNISLCTLDLLTDGHEGEAFSTWRTLHETECVLIILAKYGTPVIREYLKHMKYSLAFRKTIKNVEKSDEIFNEIKTNMKNHDLKSKDMKKFIEYGYLYEVLKSTEVENFKLNFRDGVEKIAGLSTYSKMYEFSSEIAHSSPLMIYSNEKNLFHLTIINLYESFFRIENIFSSYYLNSAKKEEKDSYLAMRTIYYDQLRIIHKEEKNQYIHFKENK